MELVEKFFPTTVMPDRQWWAALWPDPESVVRSLGVEPGKVVLDLCCGDGYFTDQFGESFAASRVGFCLLVLDTSPFGMSGHIITPIYRRLCCSPGLLVKIVCLR